MYMSFSRVMTILRWQHRHKPIRSHVWKHLLDNKDFYRICMFVVVITHRRQEVTTRKKILNILQSITYFISVAKCHSCNRDIFACLNSSPPSNVYMRQWIGSALVQIFWLVAFAASSHNLKQCLVIVNWTHSEILIKIQNIYFTKLHLKISSAKLLPFCPEGDELNWWHDYGNVNVDAQ